MTDSIINLAWLNKQAVIVYLRDSGGNEIAGSRVQIITDSDGTQPFTIVAEGLQTGQSYEVVHENAANGGTTTVTGSFIASVS